MPTPILILRLLDIPIPNEPGAKKLLLNGAKDLVKHHAQKLGLTDIEPSLFHNDEIVYSSIQISRYAGASEWLAVGEKAIHTLRLWYDLFQKSYPHLVQNTIEIQENYTPGFLLYPKKYKVIPFVVSDDLAKELTKMDDAEERIERLEKYLYGNVQTFLKFIGFEFDKDVNFLNINIIKAKYCREALPVYHQQKKTAFEIIFKSNIRLPQYLKIGQTTALGYGKVRHL